MVFSAVNPARLRHLAVALLLGCAFIAGVFSVLKVQEIERMQRDLIAIHASLREQQQQSRTLLEQTGLRLDQIERSLFGDVVAKLEKQTKPPPSWVELWQKNRDKELRDRIAAIERRLLRLER
jgi:septal ring factor EnvC (AmiA/AmiB activator)